MDPVLVLVVRSFTALVLLLAAAHKLRDLEGFRRILGAYRLLPAAAEPVAARLVPALELGCALLLLAGWPGGGALVAALLALYALAIGANLLRGRRDLDCGCGGPGSRQPIAGWMILRNAVLALCALGTVVPLEARGWAWLDGVTVLAGPLALVALYAAVERLGANRVVARQLRGAP